MNSTKGATGAPHVALQIVVTITPMTWTVDFGHLRLDEEGESFSRQPTNLFPSNVLQNLTEVLESFFKCEIH